MTGARTGLALAFVVVVAGVLSGVACSSSGDDALTRGATVAASAAANPTPGTASPAAASSVAPSPTPANCPLPEGALCAFAAMLESRVRAAAPGDLGKVAEVALQVEVECHGGPPAGIDPAARVCEGKQRGEKARGYSVGARYSEGGLVDRDGYLQFLTRMTQNQETAAKDGFGPGSFRLYTIGNTNNPECPDCRQVVFSSVDRGGDRLFRRASIFNVERREGAWWIRDTLSGIILPAELPQLLLGGPLGKITYVAWNPVDGALPAGFGGIAYGGTVAIKGGAPDCVNFRAEPSRAAQALDCLKDGTQLFAIGGPAEADSLTWWRLQRTGANQQVGWVAAEFVGPAR